VAVQVFPQENLVQRVAGLLGTGMGVGVHQTGQQPALDELGAGRGIGGPPVAVGVEVDDLAGGQGVAT